jgi:hypothetical protein
MAPKQPRNGATMSERRNVSMRLQLASVRGACAAAALIAGCAAPSRALPEAGDRPAMERVGLVAGAANAGEIGYAVLIERGHQTEIVLKVSGVSDWVARPLHLYAYIHQGSCGSPSARPAYALTGHVLARRDGDGFLTINNTLAVDLNTLRDRQHALVVRSSPADANMPLFCGDLQPG